jgi:Cu-Zn family superoxide dismutase
MKYLPVITLISLLVFVAAAAPGDGVETARTAQAVLYDTEGNKIGTARLTETPHGVFIGVRLWNMPPGWHAFHIHSVGQCEPPFKSAGGHFNPFGKKHGILNPEGMHAGDLPNIYVGADGSLEFDVLATQVTLGTAENNLFDDDGSSFVIHKGPDDYGTDPAGDAGPRIACGVITR